MTNDQSESHAGPGAARLRLLTLLKQLGPVSSEVMAQELGITPMAVRQHLAALEADGLAIFETRKAGRGRPAKLWSSTSSADGYFTDAHSALTADLMRQMRTAFGDSGLDKILRLRTKDQLEVYKQRLKGCKGLPKKLEALAKIRTEEGYMADIRPGNGGSYLLCENHCPVCAAATLCAGLCREELSLFKHLLGEEVDIVRTEHIVSGARRCTYVITPVSGK